MKNQSLNEVGEWGFLRRLLPKFNNIRRDRFLVPPGDDAAVLQMRPRAVLSIDGLTEGTHFRARWAPKTKRILGVSFGRALGWKLMGSGLSDLAAMGSTRNRWAMVYLGAPASTPVSFLMDLYQGVSERCMEFDCDLVGGDTVRARELTLVVAVGAQLQGSRALTRQGAHVGDLVCVTHQLGDAAQGLKILESSSALGHSKRSPFFLERFFRPTPRFREAHILSRFSGVTAMMDLSDPLDQSLHLLAEASRVGLSVNLDSIPLTPMGPPSRVFSSMPSTGEDYELLFTIRPAIEPVLRRRMGTALRVIGRVEKKSQGVRFFSAGRQRVLKKSFAHFE